MATLATCGGGSVSNFVGITQANSSSCEDGGGIKEIYVAKSSDIDLTASNANYSTTTNTLSSLAMVGSGTFKPIQTDGGESTFTSSLQENGSYLNTLTMYFKGTSCARQKAIDELKKTCPMVIWLRGKDCTQFISLETGTGALALPSGSRVKVSGDELTFGTEEGDGSSQTLTITWKGRPMCATFAAIPT